MSGSRRVGVGRNDASANRVFATQHGSVLFRFARSTILPLILATLKWVESVGERAEKLDAT